MALSPMQRGPAFADKLFGCQKEQVGTIEVDEMLRWLRWRMKRTACLHLQSTQNIKSPPLSAGELNVCTENSMR